MLKAKVTGRHAITLPAELCRQLGIEVGDIVEFKVAGNQAILRPADFDIDEHVGGVMRELFPDRESAEAFVEKERAAWSDDPQDQ